MKFFVHTSPQREINHEIGSVMATFEFGVVKPHKPREDNDPPQERRFGHLQVVDEHGVPTGSKDVFFNFNDGKAVVIEGGQIVFKGPLAGNSDSDWEPTPGDMLAFYRVPGKKGSKARPWVYADKVKELQAEIQSGN